MVAVFCNNPDRDNACTAGMGRIFKAKKHNTEKVLNLLLFLWFGEDKADLASTCSTAASKA